MIIFEENKIINEYKIAINLSEKIDYFGILLYFISLLNYKISNSIILKIFIF
jgi:hypothetical protein